VTLRARRRGAKQENDPEHDQQDDRDRDEQAEAATPKPTPAPGPLTPLRHATSQNPLSHLNLKR